MVPRSGRCVVTVQEDPLSGYIERFSSVLIAAGFPPMPARVFVVLLVADSGQLSAAELADMLRISPAAVSGAVQYLMQLGIVHKVRMPGSRRNYYRMPDDVWSELLLMRIQVMNRWSALLREGFSLISTSSPARARLAEHASFIDFVTEEVPAVVARWDEYRSARLSLDQPQSADPAAALDPRQAGPGSVIA
jgi:DNA-binding transcriptional regulator GbsR (MarR family)